MIALPRANINVVKLPDEVGYAEAASLGCRFITAFRGVVEQASVRPGDWLAVHGCGGVGLSAVMIAASMGVNVIAVDIDDATLLWRPGSARWRQSMRRILLTFPTRSFI